MSNHYHLVLKIDIEQQQKLIPEAVISRWLQLFNGYPIAFDFLKEGQIGADKQQALSNVVTEWQQRLGSISWFMRCLNEEIARKANKEDQCKGVFWEGRFKSQALLDKKALLSCMMYVDLNPTRAGAKQSPSNKAHIQLLPFVGAEHQAKTAGINFAFADYLELIDWTGRCIRNDKKGL